jgi:hypothetical protein
METTKAMEQNVAEGHLLIPTAVELLQVFQLPEICARVQQLCMCLFMHIAKILFVIAQRKTHQSVHHSELKK